MAGASEARCTSPFRTPPYVVLTIRIRVVFWRMLSRLKELGMSVGAGWFAVVISLGLGSYGAVSLIVHSKASGWMWIAICVFGLLLVSLYVAYQALKSRDDAILRTHQSETDGGSASVVFQGGEHHHYYGGPPFKGGPGVT